MSPAPAVTGADASITEASLEEWRAAYAACPRATFFHSPMWSLAWMEYTQGAIAPAPKRVDFADGRTAIIAASRERVRLGHARFHLSPEGTYGGWLTGDELTPAHRAELTRLVLGLGTVVWRAMPGQDTEGLPTIHDVTYRLDLREGAAAALAAWRSETRRIVRRAKRNGMTVRLGPGADDWAAYDRLYRLTVARWERPTVVHRPAFFAALREQGGDNVRLWLAEIDGEPVAGKVTLLAPGSAMGWHASSIKRNDAHGASSVLHWHIIERLADEGIAVYDLLPSGGLEGVMRFKRSVGGAPAPAPLIVTRGALESVAHRVMPSALRRWARRRLGPR